jgi:hypothetical protein
MTLTEASEVNFDKTIALQCFVNPPSKICIPNAYFGLNVIKKPRTESLSVQGLSLQNFLWLKDGNS